MRHNSNAFALPSSMQMHYRGLALPNPSVLLTRFANFGVSFKLSRSSSAIWRMTSSSEVFSTRSTSIRALMSVTRFFLYVRSLYASWVGNPGFSWRLLTKAVQYGQYTALTFAGDDRHLFNGVRSTMSRQYTKKILRINVAYYRQCI